MKKLLLILLALTLVNCSSEDSDNDTNDNPEATILGRWILPGFESNFRYEYTETKRFSLYGSDGVIPTLEEFNAQNPGLPGLDWYYDGDKIIVDLNFGNFETFTPEFVCDNYVVRLLDDNGDIISSYYREGYDYSSCN